MTAADGMVWREGIAGALSYRVAGTGSNLLLVAGLNGQARFWDAVAPDLARSATVAAFDQRGCGATPDDGAEWSIETLARDAADVAEAAFGSAPYTVIGHSTGGAIAQCMAATWPDRVAGAVLSGTWIRADAYMHALFDLRVALLERAPDLDPALSDLLRNPPDDFRSDAAKVALDPGITIRRIRALLGHDGTRWLDRIACSTVVIGAEDDRIVPPRLVADLHAALPGSGLELLPAGGHFFPQTQSAAFLRCVTAWHATLTDATAR